MMAELSSLLADIEAGVVDDEFLHELEVAEKGVGTKVHWALPTGLISTTTASHQCNDQRDLPGCSPGIPLGPESKLKQHHSDKPFKQRPGCRLLSFGRDVMWEPAKSLLDRALVGRCNFEKFCKVDFFPWLLELEGWMDRIKEMCSKFSSISFTHIYRDKNSEADRLSKMGLSGRYGEMHYVLSDANGQGARGTVIFF